MLLSVKGGGEKWMMEGDGWACRGWILTLWPKNTPNAAHEVNIVLRGTPPFLVYIWPSRVTIFAFPSPPSRDSFIGGGDGLAEQHAIIVLYIVITLMYVYKLHILQVNRAAWHIYLFIICIDSFVVPNTMEIKHIIIIVWLTLKNPCNSVIYSSCILEIGKCWQAHSSPVGWYKLNCF